MGILLPKRMSGIPLKAAALRTSLVYAAVRVSATRENFKVSNEPMQGGERRSNLKGRPDTP